MEKFKPITSILTPLNISDIDTDMIIPAQYLTSTSPTGYAKFLFARLRQDPEFIMNQSKYKASRILLSLANFGCGSSREHAVWALLQAGIKVIIAPSFSDIFFNNAAKNGLLLIKLEPNLVDSLMNMAVNEYISVSVDLEKQQLGYKNEVQSFTYDPFRKECLLRGQNDLDFILERKDLLDKFEEQSFYFTG